MPVTSLKPLQPLGLNSNLSCVLGELWGVEQHSSWLGFLVCYLGNQLLRLLFKRKLSTEIQGNGGKNRTLTGD